MREKFRLRENFFSTGEKNRFEEDSNEEESERNE